MTVPRDMLSRLCPLHVVLDRAGRMVQAGPTLQKLRPKRDLIGSPFLEMIEVDRPRGITDMTGLLRHADRKLHLRFRDAPRTTFKGLFVADNEGGGVVDMSFGIAVVDAVRTYRLTSADFAATDLTVEMLYLVEAQSAAMAESRKLNQRLQGAMIAAEEQAFTDTLTGLKNRRAVDHVLDRLGGSANDYTLMQLDLDYFKVVNDSMGHAAGDFVLQEVARILVAETRKEDIAARVGGDEFIVILTGAADRRHLGDIAARIITRLERPLIFDGKPCRISASIGIAICKGFSTTRPGDVMEQADIALYASKRAGRGRHSFYDPQMAMTGEGPKTLRVGE